jgi:hypothetical protein
VIAALKRLKVADRDKQDKIRLEIGYLRENRDRMRYPTYRERGYHIGSGVVESACKQFGARLDQAGMRWVEPGAGAIAAPCARSNSVADGIHTGSQPDPLYMPERRREFLHAPLRP